MGTPQQPPVLCPTCRRPMLDAHRWRVRDSEGYAVRVRLWLCWACNECRAEAPEPTPEPA